MIKRIFIPLFILLLSTGVFALEYTVTVNSPSSVNSYEGEKITDKFTATIKNNAGICDITCGWATSAGQDSGIKVTHDGGTNTFNFDVKADGSGGIASYNLIITCKRITGASCWTEGEDQRTLGPYEFRFLWNGDGICTTERERCANYNQFLKDSSCSCSSEKECKPNSNRGSDEKGCSTYCGNKIIEKQYEKCNDCPDDVGKCDGTSCVQGNECEGKYCIHNVCNALPYRVGDSYCDNNVGETCKNSGSDCKCGANQQCSNSGVCETFCGNGVCEASEQGICKADCNWCGDGTCESSESCSSCGVDCGECKKASKEEELQRNVPTQKNEAVSSQKETTSNNQSQISYFVKNNSKVLIVVAIIFLIGAVGLILYWKIKHKKGKHTTHNIIKCPKCHKKTDSEAVHCHHCGHKLK